MIFCSVSTQISFATALQLATHQTSSHCRSI